MSSGLGGFLFGNIDEDGKLDNEDFDEELRANLTTFSEKIQDKKILLESGFLSEEIIGEISENPTTTTKSSSAATAAAVTSNALAPVKPLPNAENFEDINELAEQVLSPSIIEESPNTDSQSVPIESFGIPRLVDEKSTMVDEPFAPFDDRQILKFTQLSARPALLNATGRSYSRYAILRKLKLKRKQLHSKSAAFGPVEDQLEVFLNKTSPSIGAASAAAARLKLSLININNAGPGSALSAGPNVGNKLGRRPWYQSRRFKDLESTFDKIKYEMTLTINAADHGIVDEEEAKKLKIPDNASFHPLSLIEWENQVIWDTADVDLIKETGLKGMYVNLNASPAVVNTSGTSSQNNTNNPSTVNQGKGQSMNTSAGGASLSSILSSLSLSNGALGGDSAATSSATATALLALIRNQQMRSASLSSGSLLSQASFSQSLTPSSSASAVRVATIKSAPPVPAIKLKFPKAPSARIINRDFDSGDWTDAVIWDPADFNPQSAQTHLILPLDDPELVFTPVPVENLSKKLGRAEKLIAKRLKKLQNNTNSSITSFSKPIPDKFNISNDKYYESSAGAFDGGDSNTNGVLGSGSTTGQNGASNTTKSSKMDHSTSISARSTVSPAFLGLHAAVPALQHSVPALKLAPPAFQSCRTKRELRLWHRPRLNVTANASINSWIKVSYNNNNNNSNNNNHQKAKAAHEIGPFGSNMRLGIIANPSGGGIIRSAKKLTLKDASRFVLLEYFEEFPPLLMNPGMGSYIVLYYRKKSPQDSFVPKSTFALVQVLDFTDPSPFMMFGDVPAGSSRYALCNGLFRAPLFPHKPASSDFLICRHAIETSAVTPTASHPQEFYLRPLESAPVLLVGQEFPLVEVPGPHSRRHNIFCRQRLQVAAYRLFNKDLPENTRKRLKIGRLLTAFPQFSEGSIRKWLKDYAESTRTGKDSGVWLLKEDAPQLDEDELRALVTPEAVCQYESMMAEQQRLLDAEFVFYDPFQTDQQQQLDDVNDESKAGSTNISSNVKNRKIGELTTAAPWNTTANFLNAVQGRCTLKLRGLGDPSGRGEAFSFVKAPGEKGTSTSVFNAAGSEYRQEMSRIWESHMNSLSASSFSSTTNPVSDVSGSEDNLKGSKLIVSRRFGPDQWISEEISDPLVIRAYLRVRQSSSSAIGGPGGPGEKSYRRTFIAPESLPKLSATDAAPLTQNSTKAAEGDKSKKRVISAGGGKSKTVAQKRPVSEKNLQIKCGACGQIGHMRTNRICPLFSDDSSGGSAGNNNNGPAIPALKLKLKVSNESGFSVSGVGGGIGDGSAVVSCGSIGDNANFSNSTISSNESLYPSPILLPVSNRPKGPPIEPLQTTRKRPRRKLTSKQIHAQFLAAQSVQVRAKLAELSTALISLVDSLLILPTTPAFHKPVPRKLYPLYYKLISHPIDLGSIRAKAVALTYKSSHEFIQDFLLLRDNCIKFNGPEAPLSDVARDMLERVQNAISSHQNNQIKEIDSFLAQNISNSPLENHSFDDQGDEISILTDNEDESGQQESEKDDNEDKLQHLNNNHNVDNNSNNLFNDTEA